MFLASLLLSMAGGSVEGFVQAQPLASESPCRPAHICAALKTTKLHGCYVVNFDNGNNGGTPLALDVTQSASSGSETYVYWINNYYKDVQIYGYATAKYYCPK